MIIFIVLFILCFSGQIKFVRVGHGLDQCIVSSENSCVVILTLLITFSDINTPDWVCTYVYPRDCSNPADICVDMAIQNYTGYFIRLYRFRIMLEKISLSHSRSCTVAVIQPKQSQGQQVMLIAQGSSLRAISVVMQSRRTYSYKIDLRRKKEKQANTM